MSIVLLYIPLITTKLYDFGVIDYVKQIIMILKVILEFFVIDNHIIA